MKGKGKSGRRQRRTGALDRLEKQLKSGKKPLKVEGRTTSQLTELSDGDVKRIKTQIDVLKKRIT